MFPRFPAAMLESVRGAPTWRLHTKHYYYTLHSLTHFWLAESVQWIFEISARDVITCRLYNNHVKVTGNHVKVKSNHVMYDRSAWFPRVHANFARLVLLAVSEEAETWLPSFCVQCIIKQLLDSVFVISRIIKVSVRVISLSLRLRLITPTSTLIILDITKTSSNNCL